MSLVESSAEERRGAPDAPAYAWVLGTGRCGSTLVHEVIARHHDVAFISNLEDRTPWLEWTGRWSRAAYRFVPPRLTTKGRLRCAPSEGYRLLARRVSPAVCNPSRDLLAGDATPWLSARVRNVFQARAREQHRPVLLHKFTGWPRAGFLDAVFPGSRFVHVVRDGRAVANSWLQMPWFDGHRGPEEWLFGPLPPAYREEWEASGRSFVLLAGLAWKMLIDAFDEAREALGPARWLELRYEDLVADPEAAFARALGFLGLPWDAPFARALAGYRFRSERSQAFRRDLGPEALALLDASLVGHLARFGYV